MRGRVLLVEDNRELLEAHESILEILGYEFASAQSGEEAWQLCQEQEFDLIISDLSMPHGDGLWLLKKLKASELQAAKASFFLSSGYTERGEEELRQMGATGLLKKPYDLVEFLSGHFSPPDAGG